MISSAGSAGVEETVLQTAPVTTAGNYLINASVMAAVETDDVLTCFVPGSDSWAEVGPHDTYAWETLPLTAVVSLSAGESVTVECSGYEGEPSTYFDNGTVTAALINSGSNSSAATAASRSGGAARRVAGPPSRNAQ